MTTPLIIFSEKLRTLCDEGWRPYSLTKLLVSILRSHFSNANFIEDSNLKNYLWNSADTTGILIDPISRWRPTTTEKRPSIVIKRNSAKVIRQGINDKLMMGIGPEGTKDYYATFLQGSHTIFCVAGESAETENLAAEVYRELIEFGPIIRKIMNLHKFIMTEIGELAILEEATENFVVPISLAYAFEEAWEITEPISSKLKRIVLTLET